MPSTLPPDEQLIVGIGAAAHETLDRTELVERLGPANVLARDPHLRADLEEGLHHAASSAEAAAPGTSRPITPPQGDPPDG